MNGRVVGDRYELSGLLGQGGMGQVWMGYDRRLDRRVGVKLLHVDQVRGTLDGDEARRRFVREHRLTAQIDHPGLVTVHDAGGDHQDLYLVMQYVEGADLADHLAEHDPYPWQWAVCVAVQLCAVLTAVHAVPVVHRDLKPRNVMIRPDGTLVVLDLGIASALGTDTTRLTRTDAPVGSPSYMAPEQAMGAGVGPGADLYALGVLLHELLSGELPFTGPTALGVLHSHLHDDPVPVRTLRPDVPEPLERLVLHLLRKDPGARPADAEEVYRALAPLLPTGDGSVSGPPPAPMDPTRPFRLPGAPWPMRTRNRSVPAAHVPAAALPTPAAPAPATTPRTAAAPAAGPEASGPSGSAPPAAPSSAAPAPDVAVAVRTVRKLLDEGQMTRAVDVLGGILPPAAEHHGARSPVVRSLRKLYAATLMDNGQYRRALPELRLLAEEFARETGPGADRQALQSRCDAAHCLEQLGEVGQALDEYRALLPAFEGHPDAPGRPLEIRRTIGRLLLAQGEREPARRIFARLLRDAEHLHGPHHPFPAEVRRTVHWLNEFPG